VWTSTNGRANVDSEVLDRPQLETFVHSMGIDYNDLAKWKCAVLQRTIELAWQAKLPTGPFPGC
jgi:hypothetical protein